ncbi:MAG: prolyl oligopeptidase family serine peptidase [Labilithrix sp.]|nr:prolyl oligopeptidase family serine peptidase [Labilithrix sp.]MCW5813324.1 prolyl oligopeptidase family serine peptidase [Labilithrix sp.]
MRRVLAGVALVSSAVACSNVDVDRAPAEAEAAVTEPVSICPAPRAGSNTGYQAGGQTRSFELLLPPPSFTGPRPLLIAFHGTGETGRSFVHRARLAEWAARGVIVVAPDAVGNGSVWPVWDGMHLPGAPALPNADLALVDSLRACVGAHFSVDAARVYAGGHSAGGIFTNHVLRMRSDVFAGGVVASGVFDFTEPVARSALGAMTVIVTWGGDNDGFGGWDPVTGVGASGFTFVEQAAMASQYFAREPNVAQAWCRGDDLGHVWLPMNGWLMDVLLARPKGTSSALALPPVPASAGSTCASSAFALPAPVATTCAPVAQAGCKEMCQLFADCAVANKSVGTALAGELDAIGLAPGSCGGCTARCDAHATTPDDDAVLACFAARSKATTCGPGLAGGLPVFDDFAACCNPHPGSQVCADLCATFGDSTLSAFVPICPRTTRSGPPTAALFESGLRP